MKALKNNRPVIVGMFILLGLLILVMTVFTLGNQKKTFVKTFTLYAVFDNVGISFVGPRHSIGQNCLSYPLVKISF